MSRDEAQLLDMLFACQKIQRYATGLDGAAFLADELRQDGILRQLTILGEAAKRVSTEYRAAHREIPWEDIGGVPGCGGPSVRSGAVASGVGNRDA